MSSYGDETITGDERTDGYTYFPNASAYVVSSLARHVVYSGIGTGGTFVAIDQQSYDGNAAWDIAPTLGYPTRRERWLASESRFVGGNMTYDQWGNQLSATDGTNRTTQRTFDPVHHQFPVSQTPPSLESSTGTWDYRCGLPATATDGNSQTTTFQYDGLFCLIRTDAPLGAYEIRQYLSLGSPSLQHVRVETPAPAGSNQTSYYVEYFDGLGRVYGNLSNGPGAQSIVVARSFHNRGELLQESAPYYAGAQSYWTTYLYDGFGRPTETRLADSSTIKKTYGLWSESTQDQHGHFHAETFDAYGQKRTSSEIADGTTVTTTYGHNLLGQLTLMADAENNQWAWTYDSLGRLNQRSDPDSGLWRFAYDDAGRVLFQDDAKNQRTQFQYDSGSRLSLREAGTERGTIFQYGQVRAGYFNVGRLTSIQTVFSPGPNSSLQFDYDAAGRRVRTTRDMDGYSSFVLQHRFDSMGRLLGVTWPDGDAVGTPTDPWRYDATGRVTAIPGIISSVTYDAAGRPILQQNVNGTATTRTYSAPRGFLQNITTTGPAGTIQNLTYDIDPAGMALSVQSSVASESTSYSYDGFHRLLFQGSAATPGATTYQYDALGRMTYNSRLAAGAGGGYYSYPNPGQPRPHAPPVVGNNSYTYDSNGNLESDKGKAITWNADNRPIAIQPSAAAGYPAAEFEYGVDGSRVKKTIGGVSTVYPLGDDYEISSGGIATKYIRVPGLGTVAKRMGPAASAQTYWLHADRQSSLHATTDVAGSQVLRRTYSAYGETLTGPQVSESRGYIDERLDETGLIFLHARYYDPALGTFLSPDPIGPAGGLNEYGYGAGDPVNIVDRSGLDGEPPCPPPAPGALPCFSTEVKQKYPDIGFASGALHSYLAYQLRIGRPSQTGLAAMANSLASAAIARIQGEAKRAAALLAAKAAATSSVVGSTIEWVAGTGDEINVKLDGSSEAEEMKDAPGVENARNVFRDGGCSANGLSDYGAVFGLAGGKGPHKATTVLGVPLWAQGGLLTDGLNPTMQMTGSYRVDIGHVGDGQSVRFTISNTTSMQSLLYGIPGTSYSRDAARGIFGGHAPGGNRQNFISWSERNPCK